MVLYSTGVIYNQSRSRTKPYFLRLPESPPHPKNSSTHSLARLRCSGLTYIETALSAPSNTARSSTKPPGKKSGIISIGDTKYKIAATIVVFAHIGVSSSNKQYQSVKARAISSLPAFLATFLILSQSFSPAFLISSSVTSTSSLLPFCLSIARRGVTMQFQ